MMLSFPPGHASEQATRNRVSGADDDPRPQRQVAHPAQADPPPRASRGAARYGSAVGVTGAVVALRRLLDGIRLGGA